MQDGIGQAPREGNLHRARARYRPRFLCDQQNEDDDDGPRGRLQGDASRLMPNRARRRYRPFKVADGKRGRRADEHENDWGGRVRLRLNRDFLGHLAHRRDPLRNWSTDRPGQFMGGHVMLQVNAGSPGSGGASPYLPPNRARSRSRGRSLRAAGEKRWKASARLLPEHWKGSDRRASWGFMS